MKNTNYSAILDMLPMDNLTLRVETREKKRGAFLMNGKKRVMECYYSTKTNAFSLVMYEHTYTALEKYLPESIKATHVHHEDWRMKDVIDITDANWKDLIKATKKSPSVLERLAKIIDAETAPKAKTEEAAQ